MRRYKKLLKSGLIALSMVTLSACEGDVRGLTEAVEAEDLNLQTLQIDPPRNSITPLFIGVGERLQLGLSGTNFDDEEFSVPPYNRRWSSSDESILTINESGLVTGRGNGEAQVSVRLAGIAAESLSINVSDAPLIGIARIDGSADSDNAPNEFLDPCIAVSFSAIGEYGPNDFRPLKGIDWTIDEDSVGAGAVLYTGNDSIDGTTNLVGRNAAGGNPAGTIVLTATLLADEEAGTGGFSATRTLTVNDSLTDLSLTPASVTIDSGEVAQLVAQGVYTDGIMTATRGVVWEVTEGTNTASVGVIGNRPGEVRGRATGTATVTASCGSFSPSSIITVTNSTGALSFNFRDTLRIELSDGVDTRLQVSTGTFYNDDNNISDSADWSSSDTAVLTVTNGDDNNAEITPRSVGQATVTAAFGSVEKSITVNVVP